MRLKIARFTFIMMTGMRRVSKGRAESLRMIDRRLAKIRLLVGPARAIRAESRLGWRRLKGSKGTGLPQPKRKTRSIKVPIGSRCLRGLREILPSRLAVGSPSLSAIKAWANSWMVTAMIRARPQIRKLNILYIVCYHTSPYGNEVSAMRQRGPVWASCVACEKPQKESF